jgi:hypothetical protein
LVAPEHRKRNCQDSKKGAQHRSTDHRNGEGGVKMAAAYDWNPDQRVKDWHFEHRLNEDHHCQRKRNDPELGRAY